MQQFLKHYRVKIRVLSPIHIGSGEKIKKKEYIYMPWNHRVIIPNVEKMYEDVCARGWEKEFTSFLMDSRNGEMPLSTWLAQKKLREADYEAWKLYEMDAGMRIISDCCICIRRRTFVGRGTVRVIVLYRNWREKIQWYGKI